MLILCLLGFILVIAIIKASQDIRAQRHPEQAIGQLVRSKPLYQLKDYVPNPLATIPRRGQKSEVLVKEIANADRARYGEFLAVRKVIEDEVAELTKFLDAIDSEYRKGSSLDSPG
jgi:hypothetical protein